METETMPSKSADEVYCKSCGAVIKAVAVICPKCGVAQSAPSVGKSKIGFLLLGIFLGTLGIHNFYAGYALKGVVQLLITILSCGFLSIVSFIWAIIEVCTVDKDARGVPFC